INTYSEEFSDAYHNRLNGQVERRMRQSVIDIGSLWYTAWVNAGQPDLSKLDIDQEQLSNEIQQEIDVQNKDEVKSRDHE
ncbi:MAG: integrase, partial [Bacteroidota bacterium]